MKFALFQRKFSKDADIVLVCAAGGQAALAGKTLKIWVIKMFLMSVESLIGLPLEVRQRPKLPGRPCFG